ncbi:MAG: MFS transporter [Thermodesulfovibrionales bacterium]
MIKKKIFGLDRNVKTVGFVSLFMDISSEMIYPLVPLFLATVMGVSKSVIGIIEGVSEATASLLKVFSGYFSDRIGNRKWLMVLGYGISTLSRPIVALSTLWQHVLIGRFVDRFGKGIRTSPRDAIIAESTDGATLGKAFGFHRSMDTLGAVVGPTIAFGLLAFFANDFRVVFWLSMIPGVIAVLLIIVFIKEKDRQTAPTAQRPKLTWNHFNWRFKGFVIIMTLFAIGNSSDVFLILRAQQSGVSTTIIPLLYLTFTVAYTLTAMPAGIVADRFGKKRVILVGLILFALVYLGFAVFVTSIMVWVLFGLYGLFMGITEGVNKAFLGTIIPPEFKATAFGIYNTCIGLALLPASMIAGLLWDKVSPSAPFYFGSFTATLCSILFLIYIMVFTKRQKEERRL